MAHEGRAERENRDGGSGDERKRAGVAAQLSSLETAAVLERTNLFDGRFDKASHQRRRGRTGSPALRFRFYGTDDFRLERRLVFFEIQSYLLITDSAQQRPHQEQPDGRGEGDGQEYAEGQDGTGRKAPGFEPESRANQGRHDERGHQHNASERQLEPPTAPDLPDHLDEVGDLRIGGPPKEVIHRNAPRQPPSWELTPDMFQGYSFTRFDNSVSAESKTSPANSRYHHTRWAAS